MHRAYVRVLAEGRVALPEEEIQHLVRVRRCGAGTSFIGLDGRGAAYLCLLRRHEGEWCAEIQEVLPEVRESPLDTTLAQSLVKLDRFEWVLQKATELGVHRLVPIISQRTEIRWSEARGAGRRRRWERILREAAKQCGRTRLPELLEVQLLEEFLAGEKADLRLALDEQAGRRLREVLSRHSSPRSCAVLVGPEGGWGDRDRALFQQRQVAGVLIGPRILRTETAPVSILSILQYEFGDWT